MIGMISQKQKANNDNPDNSDKQPDRIRVPDLSSSTVFDFDPLMREQDANPSVESPVENENVVSDSATDDSDRCGAGIQDEKKMEP